MGRSKIAAGFFTLFVMGLYRGRLLANLMISEAQQPPQSISEIAAEVEAGRLKFIIPSSDAFFVEILEGSEEREFRSLAAASA